MNYLKDSQYIFSLKIIGNTETFFISQPLISQFLLITIPNLFEMKSSSYELLLELILCNKNSSWKVVFSVLYAYLHRGKIAFR